MSERLIAGKMVSEYDAVEIEAFGRFLSEVGAIEKMKPGQFRRDHPGWLPYVLGHFFEYHGGFVHMHPPEGFGHVPITAWTFPG